MMRYTHPDLAIQTFSAVFPGHSVDESCYIDALVSEKNLINHKNYPSCEHFLSCVDDLLYHQDLPFGGTSIFAQWMTFQSARAHNVTVLLDGQGADESLLGYPGMLNGVIFDYAKKLNIKELVSFFKWQSDDNKQSLKKVCLLGMQQRFGALYKAVLGISGRTVDYSLPSIESLQDMSLYYFSSTLQSLLRYEDRNSMAFSTESRVPFLDYRLVEFVLSLPTVQKFRNTQTKWVLRQSMRGINRDDILDRRDKIGFATPEKKWENENLSSSSCFFHFIFERWLKNEKFF